MNARLKKLAIEKGICTCEIKLEGCLKNWALTWAHSKKSRFLITDEDWMEAALACVACHQKIEGMGHEKMHRIVTEAIRNRDEQASGGQGKSQHIPTLG
jgi:hypothetical protein